MRLTRQGWRRVSLTHACGQPNGQTACWPDPLATLILIILLVANNLLLQKHLLFLIILANLPNTKFICQFLFVHNSRASIS